MGRKDADEARADRLGTAAKRLAGEFIPAFYRKTGLPAHDRPKKALFFSYLYANRKSMMTNIY
jgi:hypothetical protein